MENSNIIFKNENLEIFWQVGNTPANGEAKGVKMNCLALNPVDGKFYSKYAGWIGASLALHSGVKTPEYISTTACDLLYKHKEEILPAIIEFLSNKKMNYRMQDFIEANGKSVGGGVNYKTAHPNSQKEINDVRKMMRKNAPTGTNH